MVSMSSLDAHEKLGAYIVHGLAEGKYKDGTAREIVNEWRRLESIAFESPKRKRKKLTKEQARAEIAKHGLILTVVPKCRSSKT